MNTSHVEDEKRGNGDDEDSAAGALAQFIRGSCTFAPQGSAEARTRLNGDEPR